MSPVSELAPPPMRPLPEGWILRPRAQEDLLQIEALVTRAPSIHPCQKVWKADLLGQHIQRFPEGQWTLLDGQGRVVADTTSMLIRSGRAREPHRWAELTAAGSLASHDPKGDALYSVAWIVDPEFQGMGLSQHLWAAHLALAERLGCAFVMMASWMSEYHIASDVVTPEDYVVLVERELIYDVSMSRQLRMGFCTHGVLHGYGCYPAHPFVLMVKSVEAPQGWLQT